MKALALAISGTMFLELFTEKENSWMQSRKALDTGRIIPLGLDCYDAIKSPIATWFGYVLTCTNYFLEFIVNYGNQFTWLIMYMDLISTCFNRLFRDPLGKPKKNIEVQVPQIHMFS